jgi:ABC-type multidrug transport system fused ATPase/permease subunit
MMTMLCIINFSLAVSALTSKATRGVLIGLLVFFAGVILTFVLDYQDASTGLIALVSIHPVAAFSFGLQEISYLEDRGVGLRSTTVDSSDYPSGYTFSNSVNALIFDVIFWGILTWYLNRVIPPDYGQAMPFYFPFTKSYWCPGSTTAGHTEEVPEGGANDNVPLEPVPEALLRQADEGKSIEIRNLRKAFGETLAVDGLNLSMYSGSITALLGHNGAVRFRPHTFLFCFQVTSNFFFIFLS